MGEKIGEILRRVDRLDDLTDDLDQKLADYVRSKAEMKKNLSDFKRNVSIDIGLIRSFINYGKIPIPGNPPGGQTHISQWYKHLLDEYQNIMNDAIENNIAPSVTPRLYDSGIVGYEEEEDVTSLII
mgnify:FL=1